MSSLFFLQADMASEPKVSDEGTLWTPGAVDFFRVVNAQVRSSLSMLRHAQWSLLTSLAWSTRSAPKLHLEPLQMPSCSSEHGSYRAGLPSQRCVTAAHFTP